MVQKYDIDVRRGDDFGPLFIERKIQDNVTGELTPIDMTGASVHFDLFFNEYATQGSAVIEDGKVKASIAYSVTELLPDRGTYRIRQVSPEVITLLEGVVRVSQFDGDSYA